MRKFAFILLACVIFAAGAYAQEADDSRPRVRVADLYLAKDNGSGKAGKEASEFIATDVPIYCVVQLDSAASVTVKMNLVAVNVPGVKPGTRVVTTSYTTKDNQSRVNFTGRPERVWTVGKYRVDIFLENLPAGSRSFTVEPEPSTLKSASESLAEPRPKAPKNKKS